VRHRPATRIIADPTPPTPHRPVADAADATVSPTNPPSPPAAARARSAAIPDGLVAQAQAGDREAFGTLFQLRVPDVTRYVSRILRGSDAVEDAAAETFLRAWESLPRLREPDRFDAWLFRIAHHVATDELRRRPTAQLVTAEQTPDAAATSDPEAAALVQQETERLREALLTLPDRQREVLVLRHFGGRSDAEVAAQLGTTEGNVRVLRSRATKRLRDMLDRESVRQDTRSGVVATSFEPRGSQRRSRSA
jgi:RNA polymerase sigma-70 factor (ECF subfamily)